MARGVGPPSLLQVRPPPSRQGDVYAVTALALKWSRSL